MENSPPTAEPLLDTASPLRLLVESTLDRIATSASGGVAVRTHTVRDLDSSHYLLVAEGWQGYRRIYRTLAHIALVGDRLHIYEDGTVEGIAEQLRASGVPNERIICEWVQPNVTRALNSP